LPKIRQPSLEHDYPIGGKIEEIVPVSKAR
jgi:hypothetical protein